MSLRDAISDIAADMESDDGTGTLKNYAKQLWRALRATEGEVVASPMAAVNPMMSLGMMPGFGAEAQHALMVEKAKQERRAQRKAEGLLEGYGDGQLSEGQTMIQLSGGPLDNTLIPADSSIPVGSKTMIEGHVYRKEVGNRATYVANGAAQTANENSTLIIP